MSDRTEREFRAADDTVNVDAVVFIAIAGLLFALLACCVILCLFLCYQWKARINRISSLQTASKQQLQRDCLKKKLQNNFQQHLPNTSSRKSGRVAPCTESLSFDVVCSVCLDDYEDNASAVGVLAKCRHFFHFECIWQWLDHQVLPSCPICRKDVQFSESDISVVPLKAAMDRLREDADAASIVTSMSRPGSADPRRPSSSDGATLYSRKCSALNLQSLPGTVSSQEAADQPTESTTNVDSG